TTALASTVMKQKNPSLGEFMHPKPLFPFFFQAEDGIRDRTVTGVQTCALPISCRLSARIDRHGVHLGAELHDHAPARAVRARSQIGRASCRERVWVVVGAGSVKENELGDIERPVEVGGVD